MHPERPRTRRSALAGAVLALLVAILVVPGTAQVAQAATTTYTADSSVFPNPERGFHHRVDIMALSAADVQQARSANSITLLHTYLRLDAFRTSAIDQATLDGLAAGFATARANGAKVVFRTSYNFGPYPDSEPDASEAWISTHLDQLAPVLAANADVIAYLEAGFIGAWGEWHTSTNGHDTNPDGKVRILKDILAAAPSEQVALRYPSDVRLMQSRLTAAEFARIGNHQDCYGASDPDDWGTWGRDGSTPEADKALIATVGVRSFVGGETCNIVDTTRADCETALAEMPAMHFSELNIDYEPAVIQRYRDEGCFTTMQRSFGYRLGLTSATYPTNVSPGGSMALSIGLTNSGWASVINPRPVFAVLDGPGGRFPIPLAADPRTWESGQAVTVAQSVTVPANVPAGTYRLALWLPDQATNLRSDPRYSVRLANTGTWDAATGLNVLATGITVGGTPPAGGSLVVDNFDGTPAWGSGQNDLGRWTGANSFANGSGAGVVSGGQLRLQYANNGWFGTDVQQDVAPRSVLVLRMRGGAGGEQNHVDLSIGGVTRRLSQFTTSGGGGAVVTTTTQDIRIPLAANGISSTAPGQLALSFWHGGSGSVWIDQIRFD